MRKRLAEWFGRYVVPEIDGARLPVYGRGQRKKLTEATTGEEAFMSLEEAGIMNWPIR